MRIPQRPGRQLHSGRATLAGDESGLVGGLTRGPRPFLCTRRKPPNWRSSRSRHGRPSCPCTSRMCAPPLSLGRSSTFQNTSGIPRLRSSPSSPRTPGTLLPPPCFCGPPPPPFSWPRAPSRPRVFDAPRPPLPCAPPPQSFSAQPRPRPRPSPSLPWPPGGLSSRPRGLASPCCTCAPRRPPPGPPWLSPRPA